MAASARHPELVADLRTMNTVQAVRGTVLQLLWANGHSKDAIEFETRTRDLQDLDKVIAIAHVFVACIV